MEKREIFNILQKSYIFEDTNDDILDAIMINCQITTWTKNQSIDNSDSLKYSYIILRGHLKITKVDPKTGRSITTYILEYGDIYDFFTLLDGKEHIVFPVPMENTTAIKIPINDLREIIEKNEDLNARFLSYLGEKIRELENFGESMVFDDTATRLSKLILRHALPHQDDNDHHPVKLISKLSHESLAEMVGSVRSVITTQIQKLKKEDIIINKRGYLAVKDLEKLIKKCDDFFKS